MFAIASLLGDILGKVLGKSTTDKDKILEAQSRINEQEVAGAPQSLLRLWRSFLGWALALAFVWEVMIRPVIFTYWPAVALPPSMLKEISSLLLGMLGLGL